MNTMLDAADQVDALAYTAAHDAGRWSAVAAVTAAAARCTVAAHRVDEAAGHALGPEGRTALETFTDAVAEIAEQATPAGTAAGRPGSFNGVAYDTVEDSGRDQADAAIEAACEPQREQAAAALRVLAGTKAMPDRLAIRLRWSALSLDVPADGSDQGDRYGRGSGFAGKLEATAAALDALRTWGENVTV